MILGMALGFTAVLLIAAGCYTAALIAILIGGTRRIGAQQLLN
jgi:uncharacterized membrane protein